MQEIKLSETAICSVIQNFFLSIDLWCRTIIQSIGNASVRPNRAGSAKRQANALSRGQRPSSCWWGDLTRGTAADRKILVLAPSLFKIEPNFPLDNDCNMCKLKHMTSKTRGENTQKFILTADWHVFAPTHSPTNQPPLLAPVYTRHFHQCLVLRLRLSKPDVGERRLRHLLQKIVHNVRVLDTYMRKE